MSTFLISTQYLEDYEVRFKPKGGRNFVVDAPCYFTALALVQRFLFTKAHDSVNEFAQRGERLIPSVEFPLCDWEAHKEFSSESEALAEVAEWERNRVERLVFIPRI